MDEQTAAESKSAISSPHDKLFKESFSQKKIVKSFITEYLPTDITVKMNLDTLSISKDSFIDKNLSEIFSDMVYAVEMDGRKVFLYLLFEHKSFLDKWAGYQLLKNMIKLWDNYLKQDENETSEFLPVVFPIIVYHGNEIWKYKSALGHIFDYNENMRFCIPEFIPKVIDLGKLPPEDIRGEILLKVYLVTLNQEISIDEKTKKLVDLFFEEKDDEVKKRYLITIFTYFSAICTKEELDVVSGNFKRAIEKGDNTMIALFEDVRMEAEIKGEIKGKLETAQRMLDHGLEIDQIMDFTGLSREQIENLKPTMVNS